MSKKTKNAKQPPAPSLLDNEAKGGDIAEGGLSFQEGVTLAKIPAWLQYDGFTSMIRESVCDTEAMLFDPFHGLHRDGLEAKNHSVAPSEFWDEIDHFIELDRGSPGVFQWFTLISTGLSADLQPLANGLRRVRDPYSFYDPRSALLRKSMNDYTKIVNGLGRTAQDAEFLFGRVLIEPHWPLATDHAAALFKDALSKFSEYQHYSGPLQQQAFQEVLAVVKSHKNRPLPRHEIEDAIDQCRPASTSVPQRAIRLHTAISGAPCRRGAICFEWSLFFGGANRDYPPTPQWSRIVNELRRFDAWVREYRRPRTLRISGDRRLSTSLAIGSVCSAVAGYSLSLENRGAVWSTTEHADVSTPAYDLQISAPTGTGADLVVVVSCIRDVVQSVCQFADRSGLASAPRLHIHGEAPVISAAQCNAVVHQIKDQISTAIASTSTRLVHLFIAGPSSLALFLGHRLNATGPVQCYEWISGDNYLPTVRILG